MSDFFWSMFTQFLWSVPGRIIDSIGWGGVAAAIAGGVLLLSLSARAMKLMSSPRSMVAAAVFLAAFVLLWSTGPRTGQSKPTVASNGPSLASHKVVMPPKTAVKSPPKPVELPLEEEWPLLANATPELPVTPSAVPAVIPPIHVPLASHTTGHQTAHHPAHHASGITPPAASSGIHHQAMVAPAPSAHPGPQTTPKPPQTLALAAHTPATTPHVPAPAPPPKPQPKNPPKPKPLTIKDLNRMQASAQSPNGGAGGNGAVGSGHSTGHAVAGVAPGQQRHRPLTIHDVMRMEAEALSRGMGMGMGDMGQYPMGGMHPGFGHQPMSGMHPGMHGGGGHMGHGVGHH